MATDPIEAALAHAAGAAATPDYSGMAAAAEQKYGLPSGIMGNLIRVESGGNPAAVSRQGAMGIAQLLPSTAKALGVDPTDPAQAIDGGARYLREGIDATGSVADGLRYYHGGPNRALWGPKTNAYPSLVMGGAGADGAPAGPTGSPEAQPSADPIERALTLAASGNAGAPANDAPNLSPPQSVQPSLQPSASPAPAGPPSMMDVANTVSGGQLYGAQDAAAGAINGLLVTPATTATNGIAWLADKAGAHDYAQGLYARGQDLHRQAANLAHDPNSALYGLGNFGGEMALTAPLADISVASKVPALARALQSRAAMTAAGEAVPFATRGLSAVGRSIDLSTQGGLAGAALSSNSDQPFWKQVGTGAISAPIVGAAAEKALPVVMRAGSQAQALARALSSRGDVPALPTPAADASAIASGAADTAPALNSLPAGRSIRTGAEVAGSGSFLPAIKAPPGVAQYADDGAPLVGVQTIDGRQVPQYGTAGQPGSRPAAASPNAPADTGTASIPAAALGSRGARTGIEAHDQMPPDVAATYQQLTARGVAPDEALREADIRATGAAPTAAMVSRNPAMMAAEKEGAKSESAAGQALNLQQAQANAALHGTTQDMVEGFGGPPAPGGAMQTAAESLQSASQAERDKVRALYAQADQDAARAKGASDQMTQSAQDQADMKAGLEAQLTARQRLDDAQAAYRAARSTTGADVDRARAAVEQARSDYRAVSEAPPSAPPVVMQAAPGYIDLSPVRAALNTPEMANPTIEGARSLRSGALGLMDAYHVPNDLYTAQQAESIRQAIGNAFDPMGGSINNQVGRLKGAVDSAMDATEGSASFKAARAAHKAWAAKYENPAGVAGLIRTDAQGNLVNAGNWRSVESLVGAQADKPFVQIVNQLRANGDTATLNRLKASVVQDAYEKATGRAAGSATDRMGNSVFSGSQFHNRLNQIGMTKLRALFSPPEIAKLASIGRAGVAINEAVPGTVNTSGTASRVIDAMRQMKGEKPGKASRAALVGQVAATAASAAHSLMSGHLVGGLEEAGGAGFAGHMVREAAKRSEMARALKAYSEGLKVLSDPEATRAADAAHRQALIAALQRAAAAKVGARYVANAGPALVNR